MSNIANQEKECAGVLMNANVIEKNEAKKIGPLNLVLNLLLTSTLISVIACQKAAEDQNDNQLATQNEDDQSIVGGRLVNEGDPINKSVVAVYDEKRGSLCTGSLLRDNLVMTAAHCVEDGIEGQVILFGANIRSAKHRRPVVDGVMHGTFRRQSANSSINWGDIALIRFEGTVPQGYAPSEILRDSSRLKTGRTVFLAGYGLSDGVENTGSGTLRKVYTRIGDGDYSATEILIDQRRGHGACRGDSGGPAYVKIGKNYYLWGVTSRGSGVNARSCKVNSIYTNALALMPWLLDAKARLMDRKKQGANRSQGNITAKK